jgi:hypothetical protein
VAVAQLDWIGKRARAASREMDEEMKSEIVSILSQEIKRDDDEFLKTLLTRPAACINERVSLTDERG